MKGRRLKHPMVGIPLSWHGASWALVMATALWGISYLSEHNIVIERELLLLLLIMALFSAFALSGRGQDEFREGGPGGEATDDSSGS